MRQIIIESRHEVPDDVAEELFASIKDDEIRRAVGGPGLLLRFMQEHPPKSIWYAGGGMRPDDPGGSP
jgi:hypothetical protein